MTHEEAKVILNRENPDWRPVGESWYPNPSGWLAAQVFQHVPTGHYYKIHYRSPPGRFMDDSADPNPIRVTQRIVHDREWVPVEGLASAGQVPA